MANISNTLKFGDGFNVTAQAPIDSRVRVEKKSDLTAEDSWDLNTFPPYNGMIVSIIESGELYILIDETNPHSMDSWINVGSDLKWKVLK